MPKRGGVVVLNGADDLSDLRKVLDPVIRAIAVTVGPRCEVVLHQIRPDDRLESSIVRIENGHVTGRVIGGPTTNLGLEAIRSGEPNPDRFNYRTRTKDGRELRSSSVYFHGADGQLVGALCINLEVGPYVSARDALSELIGPEPADGGEVSETFGGEISEVLDALIQQAIERTGIAVRLMLRDQKVAVIRDLDARGAFLVKRAIERIARSLHISRVTAYAYLEEARASSVDPVGTQ
jgi:predicted transcriptional regulator YheO